MEEGYAPEALVNYLCLLGWSPKDNREKMALPEVIEIFDLPQILRHNARFDLTKLNWLAGEYVREMPDERFYELSIHALARAGLDTNKFPVPFVTAALDTCKGKFKLFGELPAYAGFYFKDEIQYDPEAAKRDFTAENHPRLLKLREALGKLEPFEADAIGNTLKAVAQELGIKPGVLVHPTRLACCGNTAGPSLYHLLAILGKEKALQRIDRALERMK
jgi:glutamyl/glutaminyl-tRNA synthetase